MWSWILIIVVAVVLIALALGLVAARRRKVTLVPPPAAPKEARGGYQAGGSISFTSSDAAAPPVDAPSAQATAAKPVPESHFAEATATPAATEQVATSGEDDTASPEAPALEAPEPSATAPSATAPPTTAPPAAEDIAPTANRLTKLRGRLAKSQSVFGKSLLGLLGGGDLDEDSWQDIEDTLLMADLGAPLADEIVTALRTAVAQGPVADPDAARALLRSVLVKAVGPDQDRSVKALAHADAPAIVLVVGVNGTGKTTTTGKLARVLVADGHSVVLGAADTFRAAAADQLATWAERSGAAIVRGAEGADPAAVAFDAVRTGVQQSADVVVIDTAGRLHTKTGLMDELGKVKRVVEKQAAVDEVLLVIDATTGQNGLAQARVFADVVDVTGIVLTKLDGTAKGGIVLAVQRELGVPVKLVGLGEGPDDLAPFEAEAFVDALLGD